MSRAYLNEAELLRVGLPKTAVAVLRNVSQVADSIEGTTTADAVDNTAHAAEISKSVNELREAFSSADQPIAQIAELTKQIASISEELAAQGAALAHVAELRKAIEQINILLDMYAPPRGNAEVQKQIDHLAALGAFTR